MVVQFVFHFHDTFIVFAVAAVLGINRDELVGVVHVVVYLRRFKPDGIHADFGAEFFDVFHLVLVGFYDKELENDKGRFAVQFFFPLHDVFGTGDYLIELSAHAVLLVYVLRGAVDGNDQAVEPAFHGAAGVGLAEVMRVGGGGGVYFFG